MKKTIELTLEQAREMLGKDEAMDALIRANFTEQELNPVKRWEDLGEVRGYFVNNMSEIDFYDTNCRPRNRNIFAKKTQAEGVLAMAQLSQLMKDVNGDWKPIWSHLSQKKYTIDCHRGEIKLEWTYQICSFLAFRTPEIRDQFAKDHEELILEYFKIYQ